LPHYSILLLPNEAFKPTDRRWSADRALVNERRRAVGRFASQQKSACRLGWCWALRGRWLSLTSPWHVIWCLT